MTDFGTDNFGVAILPTDQVRITSWGGSVRLTDVSRIGTVVRRKRTGNLVLDLGAGEQVTASPGQLAVRRRDGLDGHQGNVGTPYDSHARRGVSGELDVDDA
jgi:hypothetical protein